MEVEKMVMKMEEVVVLEPRVVVEDQEMGGIGDG